MPVVSAILLVAALVLAVVIGPQTRPWTWGPAMLCLGAATLAALPGFWRSTRRQADFGTVAFGALTAGWFAWRAWTSPVAEAGQVDLLLLGSAVACFLVIRSISGHLAAERLFGWGVTLLLLASIMVIGRQILDPTYTPVFRNRGVIFPSGFFAAYNEAANYLIASAVLAGGAALFGNHSSTTRILWGIVATAGLAGIWFTHSRGGILGATTALVFLAVVLLILGKRRNAKWFPPALIGLPIVVMAAAAYLILGWQEAQNVRQSNAEIGLLFDNSIRLYLLGIAVSCIGAHPFTGGGARSFSWDCFRFWDNEAQGAGSFRPEFVHNEVLQATVDYGLIGSGFLLGFMGTLVVASLVRVLFEPRPDERDNTDAWRMGALAAIAGMMIQSGFSFVFHMLPGTILLGICLGQLSRTRPQTEGLATTATSTVLTLMALATAALLLPSGWAGTRVTRVLWPTHFGKQAEHSVESRIDALSNAMRLWPHTSFLQERATLFQTLAGSPDQAGFGDAAERAIEDYEAASRLHPFEPGFVVNRANVLSQLERDAEAEQAFAQAIHLQGGMETAFRSNYYCALHFLRKSHRQFGSDADAALISLENANTHIEHAYEQTPGWVLGKDGHSSRVSIHESLGTAREATGDREGALESYNFAATLPSGQRAHYRAGVLTGKMAVEAWSNRQPSEAMKLFIEARRRVSQAGGNLPAGVTPSQSAEYTAYLDRTIAFLKGAKVTPAP